MFVYHCNPGFPVLDSGTRLLINSEKTTEWLEDREVGPEVYAVAKPPQEEARRRCFRTPAGRGRGWEGAGGAGQRCAGSGAVLEVPDRRDAAGEPLAAFPSRHVRDGGGAGQREHVGGGRGTAGRVISTIFSRARCGRSTWRSACWTGRRKFGRLRARFRMQRSEKGVSKFQLAFALHGLC